MKYLDERIEVTFTGSTVSNLAEGIYNWKLDECDIYGGSTTTIFYGQYYHIAGSTKDTFDITDIVRSRKRSMDVEKIESNPEAKAVDGNYSAPSHTVMSYYLAVKNSTGGTIFGKWLTVEMVYRYPNVKRHITDGSDVFILVDMIEEEDDYHYYEQLVPTLQGYQYSRDFIQLVPHYPLVETSNYHFAQTFVLGNDISSFDINYVQAGRVDTDVEVPIPDDCYCLTFTAKPSNMIDWDFIDAAGGNTNLYLKWTKDGAVQKRLIGVMDVCPKRYYLMWEDRFGGYQSQAFSNNITYSESYQNTETINYRDERKKSVVSVQPKWKLVSGWINENSYCLYESIFTSPTLRLYDSQEDVLYNVIVNGSYTEKTYKNEKKMLNISLDLEATNKQNIIY